MNDLRKAAEMALKALENADTDTLVEVKPHIWEYRGSLVIQALRQALAQSEQEAFTLDRGCWERGCVAYDTRDGDGVIVYVDPVLKEKNA